MTIDFSNSLSQQVNWGNVPSIIGLTNKTIMFWIYVDAYGASTSTLFRLRNVDGTDEGFQVDLGTTGRLAFAGFTFATAGAWSASSVVVPTSALCHVAITYNKSSTANDPVIYVDTASVAITESITPSGGAVTGTGGNFFIGGSAVTRMTDCKILSLAIYNRILNATEILDAYQSRLFIPNRNGLVFAPNLNGVAGQIKDGDTLAAGNTVRDLIGGYDGVPAGSPVYRDNTVLALGGMND